jgi:PIN domain nuclease of toxin-antitoxin system
MKPYFLDTHVLLWMRENDPRLDRKKWEPLLLSGEHEVCFSLASLWEIAIKRSLGKLRLEGSLEEFADTLESVQGFTLIPIEVNHLARLESLAPHHRDPFDRLLIAQAMELGAVVVTDDPVWKKYPVQVTW